jgi:hypothetical protein
MFGYTDTQWTAAKSEVREILISQARGGREPMSYTQLTANVHSIHFNPDDHALHYLLGQVSEEEDGAGRGMLSVMVVHRTGDQMPGHGFFKLARKLGRDTSDPDRCWADELNKVYLSSI